MSKNELIPGSISGQQSTNGSSAPLPLSLCRAREDFMRISTPEESKALHNLYMHYNVALRKSIKRSK